MILYSHERKMYIGPFYLHIYNTAIGAQHFEITNAAIYPMRHWQVLYNYYNLLLIIITKNSVNLIQDG